MTDQPDSSNNRDGRGRHGGAVELAGFLSRLADKHADPHSVFALRLAQSALETLDAPGSSLPAVAVIGPTQTGKSTVVNLLGGGRHVETSALAAHTQQAAALAVNTAADDLPPGPGDCPVKSVSAPDAPPCVIWDTPDFDSNASSRYRQQVARVCGRADLVVVVLSKEKYADRAVWQVLECMAPLATPTLVCLNKSEGGDHAGHGEPGKETETDMLVEAIRQRIRDSAAVPAETAVMTLPRWSAAELAANPRGARTRMFRSRVFDSLQLRARPDRLAGARALVEANWGHWTAPVERELACRRDWEAALSEASVAFMARYRSEYIDHARHHDVAQKAVLGLLDLLEIPYLAGSLSRVRRTLTWPIRRLAGAFGRPVLSAGRDQEVIVLEAALDHCLLSLRSEVANASGEHPWWRALLAELNEHEPALRQTFREAVDDYRAAFQPRIERLSEELYEQLERNPLTLNTLRAARVSADAGGVVLAIKTGTLGLYDALFAPAVVSLTSYLTESAVGQYLRSVVERLKRDQVEQVNGIVRDIVERRLAAIQPRDPELFGIDRDELERARLLLRELEA